MGSICNLIHIIIQFFKANESKITVLGRLVFAKDTTCSSLKLNTGELKPRLQ